MPFRYVVPDSTGEAYPDLLPDAIVVTTPQSSIYVLPAQPDLSGNSQAGAPAWGTQNTLSADSISAGYGMTDTIGLPREVLQYFYHSDHVGSTAYITDRNGNVSQYAVYTAFGELFVEDQLLDVDDSQPYLFNGKELDRETGLYYYGARYYEPISSMWMSVDPLANKYPGWSPYCYTMLNPVGMVDPDGRASKRKMTVAEEVANHRSKVLGYQQELGLSALSIVNDFATGHSDAWTSGNTSKAQRNLYGEKYMADTQSDIYQVGKAIGGVTNALSGAVGKVLGYASDAVSMFDDVVNDKSEQALATFMGTLMSSITDVSLDHGKVDIEQPVRDLISWVIGESFTGLTDPNSYKPKENTKND
jgi:RHS repeat-associated protein